MKPLRGIMTYLTALLLPVSAGAGTLLDVDFGSSANEVHQKGKGAFDGVLPQGCNADFPGWNSSVATSKTLSENGKGFLRISVAKLDASVQFNWPVKDLKIPGFYKLSVSFRSPAGELPIGLRQLPAPYETLWTEQAASETPGSWCERSYVFHLEQPSKAPLGIFIYPGIGDCDLASLKLSSLLPDEYYATMKRPEKGTVNFFRNSRLPLGLQSGWSLGRDFAELGSAKPSNENGPSGCPALKLESERQITLYSEPFQTSDPMVKNSISMALKGSGDWKLSVLCQMANGRPREIASRQLKPSTDWKTETVSFNLDEQAKATKALAFKISGSGAILLDSFQAWAGSGERDFKPQSECEVALAFPDAPMSPARIQFSDEPAEIKYFASGAIEGAVLKMKACDVFGVEKDLPDVKLGRTLLEKALAKDEEKSEEGVASYEAFPGAMLGQFRIEAWLERDGKRVSPFNELLATRIKRPVHLNEDAPASPFGSHFLSSPMTISMMKAAGVNWARLHDAGTDYIGWYHLEPEKGAWTFRDEDIKRFRDSHVKIFAGLQTAPKWASLYADSGKKDFNGYFDRYFQPKDLDAWANYVKVVTSRYKGVIDEYFIWNEPWGDGFWHSGYDQEKKSYTQGPHPEADYAKLSIEAYKAAKAGNPDAKISGFNTFEGDKGKKWTQGVFDGGAYGFCDMVDYHFYTPKDQAQPGDQAQRVFEDATGYIKEKAGKLDKPVYMSEGQGNSTGGAGGGGTGLYRHTLPWELSGESAAKGADKTCRFVVANLAAGASKVFLYSAHCYEALIARSSFTVLVGPDGYPQVELASFSNMAQHLEDKKFVIDEPVGEGACAYIFEGKGGSTAVVSGLRTAKFSVPNASGLEVSDLFGNPLSGKTEFNGYLLYIDSKLPAESLAATLAGK